MAVLLCVATMFCWGSWANTQKLATRKWPFQLFYWDYSLGVLAFSVLLAFTMGSFGEDGRGFLADIQQAESHWLVSAVIGGVIFNLSNILLVAAIDIAGMAVAFPIGVGLALALGVVTTYFAKQEGNVPMLAVGVGSVLLAIVLDALAYRRLSPGSQGASAKGIGLSVVAGLLMGFFYSFVARAMAPFDADTGTLAAGKLSPYTALVFFSLGLFASSFLWNSIVMRWPLAGERVYYRDYFAGDFRLHLLGVLGGVIWNIGMGFSILAANAAGPALSYGLGQGATMVGALWGVLVWREFRNAPAGTSALLAAMFFFYILGLGVLVASKV